MKVAEFRTLQAAAIKKKPPKYRNQGKDGYASTKEARRAQELELAVKANVVRNLRRQVHFELVPKQEGERSVVYIADFCYEELVAYGQGPAFWEAVVEDVKSDATRKIASWPIKRKLMLQRYGIRIRET